LGEGGEKDVIFITNAQVSHGVADEGMDTPAERRNMMRVVIVLVGLLIALSACAPRRVAVNLPEGEVVIDPITHSHPRHCPPGQAKKGRC
jgi:hypothetical protein